MEHMIMTNSVIRQAPNKVIAHKTRMSHSENMNALPEQLPEHAREAMRPEAIGHRLKLIRMAHDLSPSEMADLLGIERTYWSRFELGRRAITDPVAALLVLRFRVTLDFVVLGIWDKLPFDLAERMKEIDASL